MCRPARTPTLPAPVALVVLFALAGCAGGGAAPRPLPQTKGLDEYVRSRQYTPFVIPRAEWGAGAIVRFEGGTEFLVARGDQCFGIVEARDTTPVALPSLAYRLDRRDTLELRLAKVLNERLDVGSALASRRVREVRVAFREPFEVALSELSVKQQLARLGRERNDACLEASTGAGHYLITRVLGARGLDYTFLDSAGRAISLDATVLTTIGLSADRQAEFSGLTSLSVNRPVLVAYRLWRVNAQTGFLESQIDLRLLTPQEVVRVRGG